MYVVDIIIYMLWFVQGFNWTSIWNIIWGVKTVKSKIKFLNKCSLCLLSTRHLFSFCTLSVVDSFFYVIFVYFGFWSFDCCFKSCSFLFSIQCPRRGHACTDIWTNKEHILFGRLLRGKSRRLRVFLIINMFLLTLRARPNSFHE